MFAWLSSINRRRREENVILRDFVQSHFAMTKEGGVVYECRCVYPESNCSSLQHHPDIDAMILEFCQSTTEDDPFHVQQQKNNDLEECAKVMTFFFAIISSFWVLAHQYYTTSNDDNRHGAIDCGILVALTILANLLLFCCLFRVDIQYRPHHE
ncbi:expressed unknown protein [Seminavis robusta]|uniref:Uncharacterized protein n=1 Tax=Seminavis robusta TaxID=568900 RepID=A0A9N8DYP4_9STRA|nr:expressed unknown protein [Seminavis robusta]|eukprot:Sro457_g146910.1 n/a (154) ;mRNA; r:47101-47562